MTAVSASPRLLLDELAAAGWGQLRGREGSATRHVLTALVRGSGARHVLVASANQVADRAGVSSRHARRCLHLLEGMGLITWTRGHIERGKPRPGWFRVRLTALRQLVAQARAQAKERLRQRRADTSTRIRTQVRNHTLWPRKKRHNPLSVHADMVSTLPLYEGSEDALRAASSSSPPPAQTGDQTVHACIHDIPDINTCALCRRTLAANPTMDVRELYKTSTERVGPPPPGWRARARALARQAAGTDAQDELL